MPAQSSADGPFSPKNELIIDWQRDVSLANLKAQQEMVTWTYWTAIVAAIAVILTTVGLFMIWRTLKYTRDAADHTRGMLEEAKTTNSLMAESVALEQRPWLGVTASFNLHRPEKSQYKHIDAESVIKNFGKIPALNTMVIAQFVRSDSRDFEKVWLKLESDMQSWSKLNPPPKFAVFPGEERTVEHGVAGDRIDECLSKGIGGTVVVAVFYDFLGQVRYTRTLYHSNSVEGPWKRVHAHDSAV